MSEFYVDVTPLTTTFWYGNIYRFWLRNFVTVFLPFFLLVLINFSTVMELKSVHKGFQRKPSRFQMKSEAKVSSGRMKIGGGWTAELIFSRFLQLRTGARLFAGLKHFNQRAKRQKTRKYGFR